MESQSTIEIKIHNDEHGLLIKTKDADRFYLALNHIALNGIQIESVAPADDDATLQLEATRWLEAAYALSADLQRIGPFNPRTATNHQHGWLQAFQRFAAERY